MDKGQQTRVRELFNRAYEIPVPRRLQWLAQQANEPEDIRSAVARLLKASAASKDFLDRPAIRRVSEVERQDETIGPYRVKRELGAGGMGVVWLCSREDGIYQREVAIKVMRASLESKETGSLWRRFEEERRRLADLDHVNIARIIDGGTTRDGLPYFVMDYIDGQHLDTYCNQRKASLRERLNLMRQVCRAVAYLHSRRVLHRDLKPSNILVTEDGLVKILDFGVAKQLNIDFKATATTMAFMTPGYASPEQLKQQPLGVTSDVYALGAILYVLLTGRQPFNMEGKPITEVIQLITGSTPVLMSESFASDQPASPEFVLPRPAAAWKAELKGDLDCIAAFALRTDPRRRYQSIEALGEDLRRTINHEPVLARGDSVIYRMSSFFRRNRAAVLAAVVVFLSLLTAAIAWHRVYTEIKVADFWEQRAQEVAGCHTRLGTLQSDPAAQHAYVSSQLKQVGSVLEQAKPVLASPSAPRRQLTRLVLESGSYLADLAPIAARDPESRTDAAKAYMDLSELQWSSSGANLSNVNEARHSAEQALQLVAPLVKDPHSTHRVQGLGQEIRQQLQQLAAARTGH